MKPAYTQKVPNGTIVRHDTGYLTILGYRDGFYQCRYKSDVNDEYSCDRQDVREKDIENLLLIYK